MVCSTVDGREKLLVVPCVEVEISKLDVAVMMFEVAAVVDSCTVLTMPVDVTLVELDVTVEDGGNEVVASVLWPDPVDIELVEVGPARNSAAIDTLMASVGGILAPKTTTICPVRSA
jgi:hypothetical protein